MRATAMTPAFEQQQWRYEQHKQQQRLRRRRRGSSSVVGAAVLVTVLVALLAFGLQGCDAQANSSAPGSNDAGATTAPPVTPRPATPPPPPPVTTPPPPATTSPPVTTRPPPPPVTTAPPPVTTAPPPPATTAPPPVTTRPPPPATTPPSPVTVVPTVTPAPTAAPTPPPTAAPPPTTQTPPAVTPQPTASPSPSTSAPESPKTPAPVIEATSAILPSVTTAPPAVNADTTSTSSGRSGSSVTLAVIVAAVVGTVFAGAVFVYVKTSRRQEAIKREFDSERQLPLPTTATATAHNGQYAQLSPARQPNGGYDAYGGTGGGSGGTIGPPPPSAKPTKSTESDSLCEPIDLNDPNFDVLTPLSDIAMAGGGLTDSFQGQSSGYYSSETPSEGTVRSGTSSSSGSVFYDPNGAMSELYPTDVPTQRQNSVSGDSDSDSDDDDTGASSFDSQSTFDMPSVSEWNASDTRSRTESAAFSIGSETSVSDDLHPSPLRSLPQQQSHQQGGRSYQDSDVSSGLHDHDASVASYSEYDRPTAASDLSAFSEYRISDTARFDSHVFSDVGSASASASASGATAIHIDSDDSDDSDDGGDYDDSSYLNNSYASDVTPLSGADAASSFIDNERMSDDSDTHRGSYSSTSSNSDDDDDLDRDSGGYSFDDSDDVEDFIGGSDSFSSTSSYEV